WPRRVRHEGEPGGDHAGRARSQIVKVERRLDRHRRRRRGGRIAGHRRRGVAVSGRRGHRDRADRAWPLPGAQGLCVSGGRDGIGHMGRGLTGVLRSERRLRSGPRHPLLGTGSIHASVIEGGQELSTYPARCVAKLERRTVPGEDGASCVREIEELIGDAPATVNMTLERQSSELAPDHALARVVSEAAGKPEQIGVAYWMDMALTNAAGIPTVAYGPAGEGA